MSAGTPRRLGAAPLLWLCSALARLCADDISDMPDLPRLRAPAVDATAEPQWLAPGVGILRDHAVVLAGTRWVDSGPDEGLALIACLTSGRLHESLVRLDSDDAALLKSAFILAFGWEDGATNDPLHGLPPRGVPVRVQWEWQDGEGLTRRMDASCLVRERTRDRALPPLPFIYTGSRVGTQRLRAADGSERMVPSFKLAEHRTLAALFDENDALLSTPLALLANDLRLEVNTALAPPGRTRGRLVVSRAVLPLDLLLDASGALRAQAEGPVLDDAALGALLAEHYPSPDAQPHPGVLRAVALHPAADAPRQQDAQVMARLVRVAVAARCWVVPVMQP